MTNSIVNLIKFEFLQDKYKYKKIYKDNNIKIKTIKNFDYREEEVNKSKTNFWVIYR